MRAITGGARVEDHTKAEDDATGPSGTEDGPSSVPGTEDAAPGAVEDDEMAPEIPPVAPSTGATGTRGVPMACALLKLLRGTVTNLAFMLPLATSNLVEVAEVVDVVEVVVVIVCQPMWMVLTYVTSLNNSQQGSRRLFAITEWFIPLGMPSIGKSLT